jgi:hypothetical protein
MVHTPYIKSTPGSNSNAHSKEFLITSPMQRFGIVGILPLLKTST